MKEIMKEIKVIKLGTTCLDKASGLKGTLTHWLYKMDGGVDYLMQPKGLDEDGQPVNKIHLQIERLEVKETDFEMVEVPHEILGSIVTDKASGFTGMAISFIRHINGCFHVTIQPKGLRARDNSPIDRCDFDLRGCSGKMIKELSPEEKKVSEKKNPSPQKFNLKLIPEYISNRYKHL